MIKIIISDYLDAYASSVTFQGSTAGARCRLPASVSRGRCHPNTAAAQAVRGFPSLACPPGGTGDTGVRQRQRSTAAPAPCRHDKPAGTGEKSSFLARRGRLDVFSGSRAAAFCSSAFSACNAWRFRPHGLPFRADTAVFLLTSGRAALCCRLVFCPFKGKTL